MMFARGIHIFLLDVRLGEQEKMVHAANTAAALGWQALARAWLGLLVYPAVGAT